MRKLLLLVLAVTALWAGDWFLIGEDETLAVIRVDAMPSGTGVEIWYNGNTRRLSVENLKDLVREK